MRTFNVKLLAQLMILGSLLSLAKADAGDPCSTNIDCGKFEHCENANVNITLSGVCVHKNVFPGEPLEIAGIICISILMLLCTAGGIGGGVVVAPMCIAMLGFGTKEAIALSGFSILCSQITKWAYSWRQKHPEKDTTAIDYGLAVVMLPTVLGGSFIGTLVTVLVPPLILQILLTCLLIFLTVQSGLKAKEIYMKE